MNRTVITSLLLLLGFATLHGQQTNAPIDFNKARQLMERRQRGETLTSDERAYLERANAERRKQQGSPANQRPPPERLAPLTDMSRATIMRARTVVSTVADATHRLRDIDGRLKQS